MLAGLQLQIVIKMISHIILSLGLILPFFAVIVGFFAHSVDVFASPIAAFIQYVVMFLLDVLTCNVGLGLMLFGTILPAFADAVDMDEVCVV